jgi:hypothetical protein
MSNIKHTLEINGLQIVVLSLWTYTIITCKWDYLFRFIEYIYNLEGVYFWLTLLHIIALHVILRSIRFEVAFRVDMKLQL